ncbi:MAG: polyisoprenyl-teichoic acid--peptidoglycan teichoic acid transferase [Chloroflexota bacterium]|nr:polyisoprenyl-teichoic acid--peptidoglycan teichoic acid transferase [Chloroflexota bacterium]
MVLVDVVMLIALVAVATLRVVDTVRAVNPAASITDVLAAVQNQADIPGSLAYKIHNGERVNILLLGYGGVGHDGGYLTDSIMVVSIQGPDRVALTSVPRDTYVNVAAFSTGGTYAGKINAAFEIPMSKGAFGPLLPAYDTGFSGAGALASKVVGDYLGITIDYFTAVDFSAFKTVVDAVGGIDVVNPYVLDDYQYPAGESGGYTHIHFNAGPLHLNGDQALIYVRERHADNDFGRSRRQQQVIAAIKDKAVSIGAAANVLTLLDAVQNNVHTNMTPNDIKVFAGIAGQLNSAGTHHVSLDNTNWQYDTTTWATGYILLLRDASSTYLQHYIQSEMVDPAVLAENAKVQVTATGAQVSYGQGQGVIWSSLLGMLNFQVTPGVAAVAPAATVIHDYSGGKAAGTAAWMAAYFNGSVVTEAPAVGGPDVVVALGTDLTRGFNGPAARS